MFVILRQESLCQRRAKMRLTMFYKSQHALVALPLPNVVQLRIRPRPRYPHAFLVPYCSTDAYKFSFFPTHSCPVEQAPSITSNVTISWPIQGRAGTTLCLITISLYTVHIHTPPPKRPTTSHTPVFQHLLLTTPCLCVIVKIDRVRVPYR